MNVLIVVAHPDDEVLGCGATGAALAAAGHTVRACFLSSHAEARGARPADEDLSEDVSRAQSLLGFGTPIHGAFPNIRMNTVAHIELVRFIEEAMTATAAQIIFTHHPSDLNDDHVQTSRACMAAARLPQRRDSLLPLRRLYFMEVMSSTEWAFSPADGFRPDTFVRAESWLEVKIAALRAYRGVMRTFPHPRSEEALRGLAAYRGSQAGLTFAEAFETAYAAVDVAQDLF